MTPVIYDDLTIFSVDSSSKLATLSNIQVNFEKELSETHAIKSNGKRFAPTRRKANFDFTLREEVSTDTPATNDDVSIFLKIDGDSDFVGICDYVESAEMSFTNNIINIKGACTIVDDNIGSFYEIEATLNLRVDTTDPDYLLDKFLDADQTKNKVIFKLVVGSRTFTINAQMETIGDKYDFGKEVIRSVKIKGSVTNASEVFPTAPTGTSVFIDKAISNPKYLFPCSFQGHTDGSTLDGNFVVTTIGISVPNSGVIDFKFNMISAGALTFA